MPKPKRRSFFDSGQTRDTLTITIRELIFTISLAALGTILIALFS